MATIEQTKYDSGVTNIEHQAWVGLANGDEGRSFKFVKPTDKTYHAFGDFGGGVLTFYGSNDQRADPDHDDHASAQWFTLKNTFADSIALSSAGGGVVAENPLWYKVALSGGAGGSVTFSMAAKKVF